MPTRKEVESQIAALQKELEDAPEEADEIWIKEGEREYKVTGARASKIFARWSDLFEDQSEGSSEDTEGGIEQEGKPKETGYFKKK